MSNLVAILAVRDAGLTLTFDLSDDDARTLLDALLALAPGGLTARNVEATLRLWQSSPDLLPHAARFARGLASGAISITRCSPQAPSTP